MRKVIVSSKFTGMNLIKTYLHSEIELIVDDSCDFLLMQTRSSLLQEVMERLTLIEMYMTGILSYQSL